MLVGSAFNLQSSGLMLVWLGLHSTAQCRPCHQGSWRWKCGHCANSPHDGKSFGRRMGFADFHCHRERRHLHLNQHDELPQELKVACTAVIYWNVPRLLDQRLYTYPVSLHFIHILILILPGYDLMLDPFTAIIQMSIPRNPDSFGVPIPSLEIGMDRCNPCLGTYKPILRVSTFNGINYQPQLVIAGFLNHQQYHSDGIPGSHEDGGYGGFDPQIRSLKPDAWNALGKPKIHICLKGSWGHVTTGVIKWDPYWGKSNIQIHATRSFPFRAR